MDTVSLSNSKATKYLNSGTYQDFYNNFILLGVNAYITNSADVPVIVGIQINNNTYILRFMCSASGQATANVTFHLSYIRRPN